MNSNTIRLRVSLFGLAAFFLATFGLMLHNTSAQAQNRFELMITPPTAYVRVKPGTTATHVISLENTGGQAMTVSPRLVDFIPKDGAVVPQEQLSFPYFTLPPAGITPIQLAPGQKGQFLLKITPPPEATEAEHYVSIIFSTSQLATTDNSTIQPAIASNLIILVAEHDYQQPLELKSFGLGQVIDSFRHVTLQPQVYNPSIQASLASGSASLRNLNGQPIYQAEIFPDVILAKQARALRSAQPNQINPDEIPLVAGTFEFTPKLLLGAYTLEYQLIDSTGKAQTHRQTVFALPLSLMLVALLVSLTQLGWHLYKVNTAK